MLDNSLKYLREVLTPEDALVDFEDVDIDLNHMMEGLVNEYDRLLSLEKKKVVHGKLEKRDLARNIRFVHAYAETILYEHILRKCVYAVRNCLDLDSEITTHKFKCENPKLLNNVDVTIDTEFYSADVIMTSSTVSSVTICFKNRFTGEDIQTFPKYFSNNTGEYIITEKQFEEFSTGKLDGPMLYAHKTFFHRKNNLRLLGWIAGQVVAAMTISGAPNIITGIKEINDIDITDYDEKTGTLTLEGEGVSETFCLENRAIFSAGKCVIGIILKDECTVEITLIYLLDGHIWKHRVFDFYSICDEYEMCIGSNISKEAKLHD